MGGLLASILNISINVTLEQMSGGNSTVGSFLDKEMNVGDIDVHQH